MIKELKSLGRKVISALRIKIALPLLIKAWTVRRALGSQAMILHVYAVCWNEETILPYFLRYYSTFSDKIFLYDNMSNDQTLNIVKDFPKVTVIPFDTGGEFKEEIHHSIKNNVWKKSRGIADWVIINDADEFLYHPNLNEYLKDCQKRKITIPAPTGFDMISDSLPTTRGMIFDEIKFGVPNPLYDKFLIFNPNAIAEIRYSIGSHSANPIGEVKIEKSAELKMLHYKYLSYDYIEKRHMKYRLKRGELSRKQGWNIHYLDDEVTLLKKFMEIKEKAVQVVE
jgi:hypothetical protein